MSQPTNDPVATALEAVAPATPETGSTNGILAAMEAFQATVSAPPPAAPDTPPPAEPVTPDPEPVKAETDPDLADLPPDATTQEAKDTWKTLKQTKKQLAEQLENERKLRLEYEEKVKKASEPPPPDPEVEARLARMAELERKIAMVDIEATEAYQTNVIAPAREIEKAVELIVKSYDGTDDQVTAILHAYAETNLKARREKLADLTADMDPVDAADIRTKANQFHELINKRDQLKADAVNALKEAKAQEERKRDQMTQMERAAYKASVAEAKARLTAALKDRFGESIVTALDTAAESVSGDRFEFSDPNVKAFAALSAAALPTIVSAFNQLKAEKAELEATLAAYDKAAPKPGGVSTQPPPTPDPITGNYGTTDILSRMRQAAGA